MFYKSSDLLNLFSLMEIRSYNSQDSNGMKSARVRVKVRGGVRVSTLTSDFTSQNLTT